MGFNKFQDCFRALVLGVLGTWVLTACGRTGNTPVSQGNRTTSGKLQVYVVNYPLLYFADRIGGELVDVHFPVPRGIDPAFWQPAGESVAQFQNADLILLNGAGYAKWVQHVSLPESKLVNTTEAVKDRYLRVEDAVTHQHGPQGEHAHAGVAFTTWLDPRIAVEQARAVQHALARLLPDQKAALGDRFAALERDLLALDREIERIVSAKRDQPLIASHPVYQYFTKRYGLNVRSVHWEPDAMPDEKSWNDLVALVSGHPARYMLWEASPMDEVVARLDGLAVQSIVFAPAGNVPAAGDFLSNMRDNVGRLRRAFE